MGIFPLLFVLTLIQVFQESEGYAFWLMAGKILSLGGTKIGSPEASISDDSSIRLQVYGRQKIIIFPCIQVISIEHRRGQFYEELDTVTISCGNIQGLVHVLTKDFINFGDVIYLKKTREGKVNALLVLPSGSCSQRTYSNEYNGIEKTTKTISPADCKELLNKISPSSLPEQKPDTLLLITPKTPEGSETVGPTYLPTKVIPPVISTTINVEETTRPPKSEPSDLQSPKPVSEITIPTSIRTTPKADAIQVPGKDDENPVVKRLSELLSTSKMVPVDRASARGSKKLSLKKPDVTGLSLRQDTVRSVRGWVMSVTAGKYYKGSKCVQVVDIYYTRPLTLVDTVEVSCNVPPPVIDSDLYRITVGNLIHVHGRHTDPPFAVFVMENGRCTQRIYGNDYKVYNEWFESSLDEKDCKDVLNNRYPSYRGAEHLKPQPVEYDND